MTIFNLEQESKTVYVVSITYISMVLMKLFLITCLLS